jgi:hypothetical protein
MAKANVNTARRDELIAAGIRPEVADAIIRLRRRGPIGAAEMLGEIPGIGPATVELLRRSLDFDAGARHGADTATDAGDRSGQDQGHGVPQAEVQLSAGPGTARVGLRAAHGATQAASTRAAEEELARRSAEGAAALGKLFLELVSEQGRRNIETLSAMMGTTRYDDMIRIQGEFMRESLQQMAHLAARFLEVAQTALPHLDAGGSHRDRDRAA